MNITIIGTGMYGISLALNACENKNNVRMWTENERVYNDFKKYNDFRSLTDIKIDGNISLYTDLKEAIDGADLIILATSAKYIRKVSTDMKDFYDKSVPICIASKGIENETCAFLSDVVSSILKTQNVAVLSGPSFAVDLLKKEPCALSLASTSRKAFNLTYKALSNYHLKFRKSKDIYGVQICGSIKNVIAIAAGILDGLGYQESTRAFLITESLHDIKELLRKLKCNPKTILSFAGMGDLILTCSSVKSRNYRYGIVIGEKKSKKEIQEYLDNNTTEGYYTLLSIKALVKNKRIKMPIVNIIHDICIDGKNPEILADFLIKKQ